MKRFLNTVDTWRHDPQIIFSALGVFLAVSVTAFFLSGLLPLNPVNFWFFSLILFSLALYRPNWAFLAFVAMLPFETVTVSPELVGLSLRPYQWVFLALVLALGLRILSGRSRFPLFKIQKLDFFLVLLPIGALISGLIGGGEGVRLAVIVASFYGLYLLGRVFLKTVGDVRIALMTLSVSSFVTALYGIAQNIWFERGIALHTVMPGRPNAFFSEPDWLGFFVAAVAILGLAKLGETLDHSADEDVALSGLSRTAFAALALLPIAIVLILTVSRSAWLALLGGVFVWLSVMLFIRGKESLRLVLQSAESLVIVFVLALVIVIDIPLTRFDLFNRAESTATGLQEITVACDTLTNLPETISSVDELAAFDCRHIDLEEQSALQARGLSIQTVRRPDPNVAIRGEIYAKTWDEVRKHPVFGIGWGNIGSVLGTDEHGSSYNASNVWLETVLGAGIIGLLGLLGAFGWIAYQGFRFVLPIERTNGRFPALPLVLALATVFLIFNLFNAGLLIGVVWILFAMAPAVLFKPETK